MSKFTFSLHLSRSLSLSLSRSLRFQHRAHDEKALECSMEDHCLSMRHTLNEMLHFTPTPVKRKEMHGKKMVNETL